MKPSMIAGMIGALALLAAGAVQARPIDESQLLPVDQAFALQASAADAVADLAARGLGVAVLSASMASGHRDRLVVRSIDDLATPALLALVWRGGRSPAVRELLARCEEEFGVGRGRAAAVGQAAPPATAGLR